MVRSKNSVDRPDVLVVEDDVSLQNILTKSLEKYGISTILAADGGVALYRALKKKPRLVLLDMLLPEISGIELLAILRKHDWGKSIPVIVLTNLDDIELQNQCVIMGVRHHYIKSNTSMDQVVATVRSQLKLDTL